MCGDIKRMTKRKFYVTILLTVLVAILILALIDKLGGAGTGYPPITIAWLNRSMIEWAPQQNASLSFAAMYLRPSYGGIGAPYNTLQVQEADLNMLASSNASCLRIDLGYAPWLSKNSTQIAEDTALIRDVRNDGMCLIIADAASESYRGPGNELTWQEFKTAWVQRVRTIAALYRPNYYIIIKEPGWYVPMVSDAYTNPQFSNASDWLQLAANLSETVKSVSPNTSVGVSISSDGLNSQSEFYIPFLQGLKRIGTVDFLGFDIYTTNAFNQTQDYLSEYGRGNKSVWIAEAWSGTGRVAYNSSRAQLDKEWMLALYYFAQKINASFVIPFFTNIFSSYTWNDTTSAILQNYQMRTPVFYEFQKLASAYGR
jgi:hypothetical protein